MAGGIVGIISDIRQRQALKQRTQAAEEAQMNAMLRAMMMQNAIQQRQANSPAAAREKRLQENQNLRQQRDLADLNYMLQVDSSKLPPPWRPFLAQLKANPDVGAAKQLMKAYKPGGMRYIFKDVMNPDGSVTSNLYAVDPDTGTVMPTKSAGFGGASSSSPTGAVGGVRPSAPAAPTSRALSGDPVADHFLSKPYFNPGPDDSGGP